MFPWGKLADRLGNRVVSLLGVSTAESRMREAIATFLAMLTGPLAVPLSAVLDRRRPTGEEPSPGRHEQ